MAATHHLQRLFGIRDDLDLTRFWWHRLAKVACWILLLAAVGITSVVAFEGNGPEIEPRYSDVRITGDLNDVLSRAATTIPNVIPAFVMLPGQLGIRNAEKRRVEPGYSTEYYLNRSICTPDALLHSQAVAETLNKQNFTRANTAATVKTVLAPDGHYPEDRRYCWFDTALGSHAISDYVKYEFTTTGTIAAYGRYFGRIAFWYLIAHLVLFNLYNRGFVYVVCGPRRQGPA